MSFIILDRDGVINYNSDQYIKSPDEWMPIPGSLEAMAALNRAGFRILIATNQSGISRGLFDIDTLDAIHEKMMRELAAVGGYIDEVFFCPHQPDDRCDCRKPEPGMLLQIEEKYPLNLGCTYFIGDSLVDVQAAQIAGCKPLLVLSGKGESILDHHPELLAIPHFANLAMAAAYVIEEQRLLDE